MRKNNQRLYQLLTEAVDHMILSKTKKEFAKAVIRTAVEYACMKEAGFILQKPGK